MKKNLLSVALGAILSISALGVAHAAYPERPVRVIVPFAPGGSTDIVTRIVAAKMGEILGQTLVVENKSGAGGAIGAAEGARAKPDGYTLSIATVSTLAVNTACKPTGLGYDPLKDFQPVTNFTNVPNIVSVNPKFPAKDFKAFVEELKANPDKYSYGSSGSCSINHLAGEAFLMATDTKVTHVPYRGSGPAVADTVGGQVQVLFDNLPSSLAHVQSGGLVAMAVAWPERLADLPDVPTYKELGYESLNQPAWYGLLAPAGTPAEVVETLHKAAVQALQDPSVKESLLKQGAFASGNTPEEFAAEIKAQYDWAHDVVKKSNIELSN